MSWIREARFTAVSCVRLSRASVTVGEGITLAAVLVTAGATTSLAIITGRLTKATNLLVGENQKMAAENSKLIAAAESEAKASNATIDEIKRDRELAHRPYLVFEITKWTPDDVYSYGTPLPPPSAANTDSVHIVNLGRGPAISAMFCEVLASSWRRTRVFDVKPNDDGDIDVTRHPGQHNSTGQLLGAQYVGPGELAGRWAAAFCEDLFGNRFRFRPRGAVPDVWRPGETEPDWSKWYREQKFLD